MTFGEAIQFLKDNKNSAITRSGWYGTEAHPKIKLQVPDEHSKMTVPYLYMEKFNYAGKIIRFPVDFSCESILAEDWITLPEVPTTRLA